MTPATPQWDADEFGLPERLLGIMPDWFYPAVGRIVAVCALLENKAQVLAETLAGAHQDSLTMARPTELKKAAVRAAADLDAVHDATSDPLGPRVAFFFEQTEQVLARRHAIVHAIWPAQPGEEQLGWRPGRQHDAGEARVTADKTRADLTDLITEASQLILDWPALHGAAGHARSRASRS